MVFISHRIHELKAICDTLTVLRDGRLIESGPMGPLSGEQIVEKMLGHELSDIFPPPRPPHGEEVLLQVDGLHDEALLQDISLRLRKGEILGIAGLAGAGKTELCKALFGASKSRVQRGELNGQPWRPRDPADSVGRGLALVPEERRKEGIFIEEPIAMNRRSAPITAFALEPVWPSAGLALGGGGDCPPRRARYRSRSDAAPSFWRQPAEGGHWQMAAR